ncbi:MAG: hydroxyacid dehydrogenase, partial [Hyphomicrobiales bacterium]|nr:hydroxyacid dehydrogenase [Hyphomicrobiales bacterium]
MAKVFLTHVPEMLENYYGARAVSALREFADVALNTTGRVLDAHGLAVEAQGCEIIISDRQTPGPAEFFEKARNAVAFLRCAVDIRNVDVEAASRNGILVARATPGFDASVAELAVGMMVDLARHMTVSTIEYRGGADASVQMGRQLKGSTLGIIGYGVIGEYLARLGLALGMRVMAYDPKKKIGDVGVL